MTVTLKQIDYFQKFANVQFIGTDVEYVTMYIYLLAVYAVYSHISKAPMSIHPFVL